MARVSPYGWLLASLVASLFVQGATYPSSFQRVVVSVLLAANLVLAAIAADAHRPMLRLVATIALIGVAVNVLRSSEGILGEGEVRTLNALVVLLGPPLVARGVVRSLKTT